MTLKDGDSLRQLSLVIGRNRNYWYTMKKRTPDKFYYIHGLGDGDLIEGEMRYMQELDTVLDRFFLSYNELEYDRDVSKFSREYGYHRTDLAHVARRSTVRIKTYTTLLKMKRMIPHMESYLEKRDANDKQKDDGR